MGRRSYEIMGPHWAASEGPIATAMNEKPKAVFSHTLEKAEWGPAEIFGGDLGAAIADLGRIRLSGFPAWLFWCFVHILFLIGFRNRVLVMFEWAWSYLTSERGARLITGPWRSRH